MRAIDTARRRPDRDEEVTLPRPGRWAVLAVLLAGLAVADLVALHRWSSGVLLDIVNTTLGHNGIRLGSAALLGVGAVWAGRRSWYALMARRPGGVEVRTFTAHDAESAEAVDPVTATFRRELSALRFSAPTPVPGAASPQNVIQAFRTESGSASTLVEAIPGVLGWLQVTTGYEVSAELQRQRSGPRRHGLTVHVHAQPSGPVQRVTVWSTSWDDVARRAADIAGAYILTRTGLCRRGPWSAWRGRKLNPDLLRAYQDGQMCVRQRRYEEALDRFYLALEMDPLNAPIRIEVCQLLEKLGNYLGALVGYFDLIVTESRHVDPGLWRRLSHYLSHAGPGARPGERRARRSRRRRGHESLMIARYRFVCALVNGDRVIDEWTHVNELTHVTEPEGINAIRSRERMELRRRMSSWLRLYYREFRTAAPGGGYPDTYDEIPADDRGAEILSCLLRYVATVEAGHLARDYAWHRGRRMPGMPISETSLAVLRVWAPLHLLLVCGGEPPRTREGDRLRRRIGTDWPLPRLGPLEAELRTALDGNPMSRRGWQDNYNVAAAFAVLLLRRPRGTRADGRAGANEANATDAAARAVRYLELAVNSSSPAVRAEYEEWVSAGDQDLNGLRGTQEYVDFLERSFPGRERWERRPYDLLTFLMSTHLLTLLRDFALLRRRAAEAEKRSPTWVADLDDVRLLHSYSTDHADWRTRLPMIRETRRIAPADEESACGLAAFPRFSDDPGLRSRARKPSDVDETGVDAYYERLTDQRHSFWTRLAAWSGSLAAETERRTGPDAPPGRWRDAVVETWRAVHELCDAALRGDAGAVAHWTEELGRHVDDRIALLRGGPPSRGERNPDVTAA